LRLPAYESHTEEPSSSPDHRAIVRETVIRDQAKSIRQIFNVAGRSQASPAI